MRSTPLDITHTVSPHAPQACCHKCKRLWPPFQSPSGTNMLAPSRAGLSASVTPSSGLLPAPANLCAHLWGPCPETEPLFLMTRSTAPYRLSPFSWLTSTSFSPWPPDPTGRTCPKTPWLLALVLAHVV